MVLQPSVFKSYDIRGLYPQEFDREGTERITEAFLAYLFKRQETRRFVLAYDMRPSSPEIAAVVSRVLREKGVTVLDIGKATTPLFYFALYRLGADGGIMVTASHNPAGFNGFKLMGKDAEAVGGELLKPLALQKRVLEGASAFQGRVEQHEVLNNYLAFLRSHAGAIGAFTIAIDAGNGIAGLVLNPLLDHYPQLTVHKLYFEPDGTFPNHEANPVKDETLQDLIALVRRKKADIGVAFDGDGDRVRFVTAEGEPLPNDFLTALLAREFLQEKKSGVVVHTVTASRVVAEAVRASGGTPARVRVGHRFIRDAMKQHRAVFGGEHSGHFYWPEFHFRESAAYTMLRVLAAMTRHQKTLAQLTADFRSYVQSGEINFEVKDKQAAQKRAALSFRDGKQDTLDGLTVSYEDWWFSLRPSNTEDLVRLNVEARSKQLLEEKIALLKKMIEKA